MDFKYLLNSNNRKLTWLTSQTETLELYLTLFRDIICTCSSLHVVLISPWDMRITQLIWIKPGYQSSERLGFLPKVTELHTSRTKFQSQSWRWLFLSLWFPVPLQTAQVCHLPSLELMVLSTHTKQNVISSEGGLHRLWKDKLILP
jgi:hypothetical protein